MVAWGIEAFLDQAVGSLTAGDASITVGGTATAPVIEAGTLDQIAALHPPAAAVAMNSKKLTGLANGAAATDAAAVGQVLQNVASTGTTGYTLVNGTGNILTWTAPNDGQMHRVVVIGQVKVTTNQTGGAIGLTFTYPDGSSSATGSVNGGGSNAGYHGLANVVFLVAPNTTVTLAQTSAQSAGAAIGWFELWAN